MLTDKKRMSSAGETWRIKMKEAFSGENNSFLYGKKIWSKFVN